MFTSAKVFAKIEESDNIDGLDKWLENYLCNKFVASDGHAVTVTAAQVKQQGWKSNAFINAMKVRGFMAKVFSEQRDGDYYLIHLLPPAKETEELA